MKQKPQKNTPLTARHVAWQCLKSIFVQKQTLDSAFGQHAKCLKGQDRAFAYTLVMATTRYSLAFDKICAKLMAKPFPADSAAQQVLRLGLCQLLCLDGVKDHAAINTTVDLAKSYNLSQYSGVINGVLRNVQRNRENTILSATDALPPWLEKALVADYGAQKTASLAKAMLTQAPLHMRCREGIPPEGATPLEGLPDGWCLPEHMQAATLSDRLKHGEVYIQDMAAQWPAFLLNQHLSLQGPVLDICAAPGGKTLQLADGTQRFIVAADRSQKRLKVFTNNMQHTPNKPATVAANGCTPPFAEGTFAGVLLDAPCSAIGTSRRHPDVLHLRTPADVQALVALQQKMLAQSAALLQKGGVLVYAVCSPLHEEGEKQNLWALKNLPLKPCSLQHVPKTFATNQPSENALRFTPLDNCDGFYMALYEKA